MRPGADLRQVGAPRTPTPARTGLVKHGASAPGGTAPTATTPRTGLVRRKEAHVATTPNGGQGGNHA